MSQNNISFNLQGKHNRSECEKERQSVFDSFPIIQGERKPPLGAFIPQCNEDGSYKKVQCHGSTGHCWCVDESGTKQKETEVRFKQPDCEKGIDMLINYVRQLLTTFR